MIVEQFVMAYLVEQDRIRALLPEGYESLRPVLRINAEIRDEDAYIEFNTPVACGGKRGWLNIDSWQTPEENICVSRDGKAVKFQMEHLDITYIGVGVEGSCPAERDNDGCFFIGEQTELVPPEKISANKEFCDCVFSWKFAECDAHGESIGGRTLPASPTEHVTDYPKMEFSAKNFAAIDCEQMLGQYKVVFERK